MNMKRERELVLRDHFNPTVEHRKTDPESFTHLILELMAASDAHTGQLNQTEWQQLQQIYGHGVGYDWNKAFTHAEIKQLFKYAIKGDCVGDFWPSLPSTANWRSIRPPLRCQPRVLQVVPCMFYLK